MRIVKMCMGVNTARKGKGRQGDMPCIQWREVAFNIFSDDQSSHPDDLPVVVFFEHVVFSCGITILKEDAADVRICKNKYGSHELSTKTKRELVYICPAQLRITHINICTGWFSNQVPRSLPEIIVTKQDDVSWRWSMCQSHSNTMVWK